MENKEEKLYQIKDLSEKQIKVMKDALEMYTRLGILQFDHLVDHMFNWGKSEFFSDAFLEHRDEIQKHCFAIRNLLASKDDEMKLYNENGHWSLGIGGPKTPVVSQIAYELEKDIETVLYERVRGRLDLSDETPIKVSEQNLREEKLKQIVEKLKDK